MSYIYIPLMWIFVLNVHLQGCLSYVEYTLESAKPCSPLQKTFKIKMIESDPAVIVRETRTFDKWPGHISFSCKFEIKEVHRHKIIAVIQKLSFREDEYEDCIDYVQFKSQGIESKKYCGYISSLKSPETPVTFHVPRVQSPESFITPTESKLEVYIYVAAIKAQPDELLDLVLAFTATGDCSSESYQHCKDGLCIMKEYFNDGIVNCPFTDCPDEGGCIERGSTRPRTGTKVTVGAVVSVVVSFMVFFGVIWLLRRYQKVCWSTNFNNPQGGNPTQLAPIMHHRVQTVGPEAAESHFHPDLTQPTPSEPAEHVTIIPDKDLPPPYESLFPGR